MTSFRLMTDDDIETACQALRETPRDGHSVMVIKEKGTKSQRQRGLQWMLYKAIAKSGIGSSDVASEVDLQCKYLFRYIWLIDDDLAAGIFAHVLDKYKDQMKEYVANYLHTEQLSTAQMAEYLTSIYHYWGSHGVELPSPDDYRDELEMR